MTISNHVRILVPRKKAVHFQFSSSFPSKKMADDFPGSAPFMSTETHSGEHEGKRKISFSQFHSRIIPTFPPARTMRTFTVATTLVTVFTPSADASPVRRLRTQPRRKSLSSRRDEPTTSAFLDFEPTFRRLELSMSFSASTSLSMFDAGAMDDEATNITKDTAAAIAEIQTAEVEAISG
jgi:hypothetical protein